MKSYKEVEQRLDVVYNDSEKQEEIQKHLGYSEELFWSFINLIHFVSLIEIKDEKADMHFAKFELCTKFINNSVGCYKLLCNALEHEFLVLLRQNIEISSLFKYFLVHPDRIMDWIRGVNRGEIRPSNRREAVDGNTVSRNLYKQLCDYVHTNTESIGKSFIGAIFDPNVTDHYYLRLFFSMFDMLGYLYENIEIQSNRSIEDIEMQNEKNITKFEISVLQSLEQFEMIKGQAVVLSYRENPEGVKKLLLEYGDTEMVSFLEQKYN